MGVLRGVIAGLTAAAAAGAGIGLSGTPAYASCAAPPNVATSMLRADAVVVGTVTAARSHDRLAVIRVEERWKGQVPAVFELRGGPDGENIATSVDRSYRVGQQYLLFVIEPAIHGYGAMFGGTYEDNGCSATQPFTPDLARFRPLSATTVPAATSVRPTPAHPASADAPRPPTHHSSQVWWIVILGLTSALAVAAIAFAKPRLRRHVG